MMDPGEAFMIMAVGGTATAVIALGKSRNAWAWGIFGAFMPLIALIAILTRKDKVVTP
jgi:hypothetical protein